MYVKLPPLARWKKESKTGAQLEKSHETQTQIQNEIFAIEIHELFHSYTQSAFSPTYIPSESVNTREKLHSYIHFPLTSAFNNRDATQTLRLDETVSSSHLFNHNKDHSINHFLIPRTLNQPSRSYKEVAAFREQQQPFPRPVNLTSNAHLA